MSAQHSLLAVLTYSSFHGIANTEMAPNVGSHIETAPNIMWHHLAKLLLNDYTTNFIVAISIYSFKI